MVGKGSKTPGHKGKLNASTPYAATGKKGKGLGRDDRTVDVGALLRGKIQDIKVVPKLRGEQQENQGENSGSSNSAQPLALEPNSNTDSALPFSPDDSLAAAASKLAHLKASRVGTAAAVAARLSAEQSLAEAAAAEAAPEQPQAPPAAPECPAAPSAPQSLPLMASPEYQPDGAKASDDEEGVPLAARTALTKRHRRKSQHQGPERFGDWFTGDDAELDETLAEYNDKLQEEQRQAAEHVMTRAQRRKSALPAVGRSVQADFGPILRREASADDAASARQDVAARVQAITTDICNQLDGLIQASPREKGRRRQNGNDDKSLHEKLVEAWDGRSYYDRLKAEASKDDDTEEEGEEQQQEVQVQQLQLPAPLHERLAKLEGSGVDSDAETVTTPSRAQQEQQLCELTESLKKLQVSTVNRTSKAAAVLANRVRSAPGSRSGSPNVAAAARGQAAVETELARAVSAPSAEVAASLSKASKQQQQGGAPGAVAAQQRPRAKGTAAVAARKRSISPAKAGPRMALAPVRTSLTALKRQTTRQASSPVAAAKRPTSRVSSPVAAVKRSAAHVASPSAAAAAKRQAAHVASPSAAAAAKRSATHVASPSAAAAAKRLATKQPASPAAAAAKRLATKQPASPAAAAAAKRLAAKQPSSPAAAAAAKRAATTQQPASPAASQLPQEAGRVTRSKSRSPEPTVLVETLPSRQRGAGQKAGASPLGPASARGAAAGASQAPNTAGVSISREQSRAELEPVVAMATAAEDEAKPLQEQLAEEKQARKDAEEQAAKLAAELKEERKARKAAERKVEELQRRLDQAEEAERTLSRVAEKAAESTVHHSAAENQMTAILKAANSLMKHLGQGKQDAQALLEMAGGAAETAAALTTSKGAAAAAVVPAKAARQQPAAAKPAAAAAVAAANSQNTGGWR